MTTQDVSTQIWHIKQILSALPESPMGHKQWFDSKTRIKRLKLELEILKMIMDECEAMGKPSLDSEAGS